MKGNYIFDFLFAALVERSPYNGVFSKRKEFALKGANSFLPELTPIKKGGKVANGKVEFF